MSVEEEKSKNEEQPEDKYAKTQRRGKQKSIKIKIY